MELLFGVVGFLMREFHGKPSGQCRAISGIGF
jgi:hypothetical protein